MDGFNKQETKMVKEMEYWSNMNRGHKVFLAMLIIVAIWILATLLDTHYTATMGEMQELAEFSVSSQIEEIIKESEHGYSR